LSLPIVDFPKPLFIVSACFINASKLSDKKGSNKTNSLAAITIELSFKFFVCLDILFCKDLALSIFCLVSASVNTLFILSKTFLTPTGSLTSNVFTFLIKAAAVLVSVFPFLVSLPTTLLKALFLFFTETSGSAKIFNSTKSS
jgi:hypothetical protein